ncbi:Ig-like domain-containing protein [Polymorphospora lycopeni]|uniref:Ig-like domain-containing protein n=1 Tax=Polymorphospora lycopeni TaxID=3140240 RepID=A0ABV5D0Z0_9ACTN
MSRRILAALVTSALSLCAVVAGVVLVAAGPAQAASLGEVRLSQTSGNVDDTPMFATAGSAACPTGYGENAGLRVGRPGGPYSNLGRPLGGGGFDTAPVSIEANRSFTTALGGAAPAAGEWWVIVECFSLTEGRHPDQFQTTIHVCGTQWRVGTSCSSVAATQTTLTVEPADRIAAGTPVTLTAAVTPAVPGTVVFRRATESTSGSSGELGAVPVSETGTAVLETGDLPLVGATQVDYTLTATFNPTDPDAYAVSTASRPLTVYVGAEPVTVDLTVDPASPAPSGGQPVLTATVDPAAAAGTVTFERRDSGEAAFAPVRDVPVADGRATLTMTGLADGAYDLQATFRPADPDRYTQAVSNSVNGYRIGADGLPATDTTTTLTVTPDGSQPADTPLTLTATVAPNSATGTVRFLDGQTELGTAAVAQGTAAFTATLAVGTHSLKAVFTPADATAYRPSESAVRTVEITAHDPGGDPDDPGDDPGGDPDGGGGMLPRTGISLIAFGMAGLSLVGAGSGAMLLTRRRRPEPAPVTWPDSPAGTGAPDPSVGNGPDR